MDFCQHHEQRGNEIATCKANIENMDAWVAKLEQKMEAQHAEQMRVITEMRDEMNQYKGAGWVLVKIGALIVGIAALTYYILKIFRGG